MKCPRYLGNPGNLGNLGNLGLENTTDSDAARPPAALRVSTGQALLGLTASGSPLLSSTSSPPGACERGSSGAFGLAIDASSSGAVGLARAVLYLALFKLGH